MCRTTCALTVVAAAIAASITVPAVPKDAQDVDGAYDSHPDSLQDSSEDGTGVWLLGDEEDARCKVRGMGGKEAQAGGCYSPPAVLQQQYAVQQYAAEGKEVKDSDEDESAVVVLVGSSGASDTESVGSDHARHSMEEQQQTGAGHWDRPSSSAAWHADEGSPAASSSRASTPRV